LDREEPTLMEVGDIYTIRSFVYIYIYIHIMSVALLLAFRAVIDTGSSWVCIIANLIIIVDFL
jgi:hypothetical protein